MQNRSDKNKKQNHIKNKKKFLQQEIQNTTDEKVKLELTKMLIDIDSRRKHKKRGLILTLFILLIIILVTLYVYGYKKEATSKSENITSNSLIEKNLWDENKEKELHSFIGVWGESMTQKYEKYSLDRPLYLNEVYIPNSIIGESPEIEVLINGKKQILNLFEGNSKTSDYKIVSVYSDIDDSQNESAEKHLYLFTFKGDKPTVLVSNLAGNLFDTLNFKDTENIDLKQGFDAIVYSEELSVTINENEEIKDSINSQKTIDTTNKISSEDAIELAKKYMTGENSSTDLESYSFRPAADLIGDDDNPHYAIYVRQKATGDFDSMAIGTIYVNAKTGECHWQ